MGAHGIQNLQSSIADFTRNIARSDLALWLHLDPRSLNLFWPGCVVFCCAAEAIHSTALYVSLAGSPSTCCSIIWQGPRARKHEISVLLKNRDMTIIPTDLDVESSRLPGFCTEAKWMKIQLCYCRDIQCALQFLQRLNQTSNAIIPKQIQIIFFNDASREITKLSRSNANLFQFSLGQNPNIALQRPRKWIGCYLAQLMSIQESILYIRGLNL